MKKADSQPTLQVIPQVIPSAIPPVMLDQLPAWKKLGPLHSSMKNHTLTKLFAEDPERFNKMQLQVGDWLIDYSKNLLTPEVLRQLMQLAREAKLEEFRAQMFEGEKINRSEKRAVLHTALRSSASSPLMVDQENIRPLIEKEISKMEKFCHQIHSGHWKGITGQPIKNVVNLGIGGSDLGPKMVCEALEEFHHPHLKTFFVSNVDPFHLKHTLKGLDPAETLFIIASKTFTTVETMANAYRAQSWLLEALRGVSAQKAIVAQHFVAVSTNTQAVVDFGIKAENIFTFWDWVGGRFSLSSSIGLSIMLATGPEHFRSLLSGMSAMDEHFRTTPLEKNAPVLMALIGVWHHNFCKFPSVAVIPYAEALASFPAYLQQTDMESNGKSVDRAGQAVRWETGPIIWGGVGTNAQHAFFQHLHQSPLVTPVDFILFANGPRGEKGSADLQANCLAQSQALAFGRSLEEVLAQKKTPAELAAFKVFEGNRPSTTLIGNALTPFSLGQLIALYEHKVFVQGIIWGINSFDQWGVELGKELAQKLIPNLATTAVGTETGDRDKKVDSSTKGLIAAIHYQASHAQSHS